MPEQDHIADAQRVLLLERVQRLESMIAERDARARKLLPATTFLSLLLVVFSFGLLIANLTLPHLTPALSALIQSALFTSLLVSICLSLMAQILRTQTQEPAIGNQHGAVAAIPVT
jgi:hypothetical protein